MTVQQFIAQGKDRLAGAGLQCADPLLHMKQLVALGLGLSMSGVYVEMDRALSSGEIETLQELLARRLDGEPFQYIAGEEEFWSLPFKVGPGVLIPRPETEHLVEAALRLLPRDACRIAELGAGSGNIGIALLTERPQWEWHAFEINPASIPYIMKNREQLLPESASYHLHLEDLFVGGIVGAPWDALITNPPYVASEALPELLEEVKYEPMQALDGGPRGLEVLRRLFDEALPWIRPGGWFMAEIGSDQGEAVLAMAQATLENVELLRDYGGLARVVTGNKRG